MGNLIFGFIFVALIFIPLERFFALHKEQRVFRKGWFNDVIHFFVNQFLIQAGVFIIAVVLLIIFRKAIDSSFQASVAAQPKWLQFIEALLIAEIVAYWMHRLAHTLPWLWKFHSVHHSIEEMDWLASARLHPVDQIITKVAVGIPLYLMGFTAETFGLYLVLGTLQAIFLHSNVRIKFGPLRWLIGTPEFHHWHHSNEVAAYNKNFAGQLPLLDLLFGTLHLPKGRMPEKYGINQPIPHNYLKQLAYPFRKRA